MSSSRSLTNFRRCRDSGFPSDDLRETFAAIGSAFDKTNTQMTYLHSTKTIDKHFAFKNFSKLFTINSLIQGEFNHEKKPKSLKVFAPFKMGVKELRYGCLIEVQVLGS